MAVGNNALHAGAEPYENVAVGIQALERLEGARSLAAGKRGERNTAVGAQALEWITKGENNTAIGWGAGQAVVAGKEEEHEGGSGNVFVGFMAGRQELNSNKLYIANSETTEPLVFGEFPNASLSFNTNKIALYKGVTPVTQHATIASPAETIAANTQAIKEIIEAIKGIGLIK